MGNTLILLAMFVLSMRIVLPFTQKSRSEGFFFGWTLLLSSHTESDHQDRLGAAFGQVNLAS